MKNIMVTAGGTREYIDDVRVLTNISSGKLGKIIANQFLISKKEYNIHYICPKNSFIPNQHELDLENGLNSDIDVYQSNLHIHYVTDVASVMKIMEELVPKMDIVIHSMAVSDFGFKPITEKLKSNDPEAFIESMKNRIYKTPKILSHIKTWNPKCILVSFKFEVNLDHDELIKIARNSMIDNGCDIVVANDKTEMVKNKSHIAYILSSDEPDIESKANNKYDIAKQLYEMFK